MGVNRQMIEGLAFVCYLPIDTWPHNLTDKPCPTKPILTDNWQTTKLKQPPLLDKRSKILLAVQQAVCDNVYPPSTT